MDSVPVIGLSIFIVIIYSIWKRIKRSSTDTPPRFKTPRSKTLESKTVEVIAPQDKYSDPFLQQPIIEKRVLSELVAYCRTKLPNIACGILAGNGLYITRLYKVTNSTPSPYRFNMARDSQMDAMRDIDNAGGDIVAFFSSRPNGSTYPSETDVRMAVESGWTDFHYVYVGFKTEGSPDVAFYWIDPTGNVEMVEPTTVGME